MHLISALLAGVRGAENGTAQIYARGTSGQAPLFSAFEGGTLSQPGSGLVLDANGAVEVYVNELVDVICKDSTGVIVRSFTAGSASGNVEVQSLSFTGVDYDSGASAVGNPTTLQHVLDLIFTSFGARDFNALFNGSSTSVQNALGSIAGIFTNVKSPQFGAVGDGVADDTTAVQNALNQSNIVYFPAGTYRTTSKLTVPVGTSLWGSGSAGSKIFLDHATADCLEYGSGTSTQYQEIRGLQVDTKQANSGMLVSLTNAGTRWLAVTQCTLGSSATLHTGRGIFGTTNAHRLLLVDSDLYQASGASNNLVNMGGDTMRTVMRNARLIHNGGQFNLALAVLGGPSNVFGCTFDLSAVTSGTPGGLQVGSNTGGIGASGAIVGNDFSPAASSTTCIGMTVTGINDATTRFFEIGNVFRGTGFSTTVSGLGNVTTAAVAVATFRDSRVQSFSSDAATLGINPLEYGHVVITRGTDTGQTMNANVGPPGSIFTLIIINNIGGNLSTGRQVFGTGFVATTPAIPSGSALASAKVMTQTFRVISYGGSAVWVPVAAQVQGLG